MGRLSRILTAAALAFGPAAAAPAQEVTVVTTIPDLTDLVQRIGGPRVETVELVAPGSNPHQVIAKASMVLKVSRADGLVCMGLDLEHAFLPAVLEKVRQPHLRPGGKGYAEVGPRIRALEVPEDLTRARAVDVHPHGNPHFNMDPRNGLLMAETVRDLLVAIDPAGADGYRARWEAWDAEARRRIADWAKRMAPVRGSKVLTYHRSWSYFADCYQLELAGEVEPKPGLAPTARHLAELAKRIEEEELKVLLMEPWYPESRVQGVAGDRLTTVRMATTVGATRDTLSYLDFHEALVRETLRAFGVEDPGPAPAGEPKAAADAPAEGAAGEGT